MGINSVGTFVNGMQNFIGNNYPINGNITHLNETEMRDMMTKMQEQYQKVQQKVYILSDLHWLCHIYEACKK